jgi:hypothetical protein
VSDSAPFQAFARLPGHLFPSEIGFINNISRIQPATSERINQRLLLGARYEKEELGKKVRIDSTVTETDVHAPSDGSLFGIDTDRLLAMLERHTNHYGCVPEQVAVESGYASKDDLDKDRENGIKDVALHEEVRIAY